MNGTYRIAKAARSRTYDGKYGEMVVWKVRLEDVSTDTTGGVFELHKKPGNEPKVGDTLEVERSQEGEFDGSPFVRLYLAKPQNTGGGSSGGKDNFDRRPEHPRNEARMIHTAALGSAPEFYRLLREEAFLEKPASLEAAKETLLGLTAWLEASYHLPAADAAAGGGSTAQNGAGGQQEIPADTRDMQPAAAASSDQDIPF